MDSNLADVLGLTKSAKRFSLTESDIRIEVQTAIEGVLARVSTAPCLSAARVHAQIDLSGAPQVSAQVDAASLQVVSERISLGDRARIASEVAERVLRTKEFPTVEFSSTQVAVGAADRPLSLTVQGHLLMNGVTKELSLEFTRSGARLSSQFALRQSDFGITPLSAMKGALRCKDEIKISVEVSLRRYQDVS